MATADVLDETGDEAGRDVASPATRLALKEWSAAIHALLDGRQSILLRKGGIHEKAFTTPSDGGGFLLFPTVAHAHAERTRPEHHDLLPHAAADVSEHTVTIRAAVHLIGTVEVSDASRIADLEDLHIWTSQSIRRDRIEFRPVKALTVMVVQAIALEEAVTLPRLKTYGGCKSWIDLHTDVEIPRPPTVGRGRSRSSEILQRVRDTIG